MTIASETNRSGPYACNGVTTHFPYGFRIYDAAHIRVILTAPDGTESILELATDYAVAGVGESGGGAVDTTIAYAAGYRVTLVLNVPFTQNVDLENQGAYFAETIERAIDLQTQMSLQLKEQVARSVVLPVTSSVSVDKLTGAVLALADVQPQLTTLAPIAEDIKAVAGISGAVVAAEGNASTAAAAAALASDKATEAAASADAARTWNPAAYSTTEQVTSMLSGYVPAGRKIKVGAGLSLNGVAGSDENPAEGDLSEDRILMLRFASPAETVAGTDDMQPVHSFGVYTAITAVLRKSEGLFTDVYQSSTSGAWVVPMGVTKIVAVLFGGGGGGGGTYNQGGYAGGLGGMTIAVQTVTPGVSLPYLIGAGGAGGSTAAAGAAGGASTFNGLSATGGAGGGRGTQSPGSNGIGSGGDWNGTNIDYVGASIGRPILLPRIRDIMLSCSIALQKTASTVPNSAGVGPFGWAPASAFLPGANGAGSTYSGGGQGSGAGGGGFSGALFIFVVGGVV